MDERDRQRTKVVSASPPFDPTAPDFGLALKLHFDPLERAERMNANLRYLSASRVDTPVGDLQDALVLGPSQEQLGKLSGVLVDPHERRLCYFVVESGHWLGRRQHLVPAGLARIERQRKALCLDVGPDGIAEYEECRSDRLPAFSDEDVITAIFSTGNN